MDDLTRLLHEAAIHRVLHRYCRGIDRLDAELIRSAYWPDASDDHGVFKGRADDFVTWVVDALRSFEQTQHFLGQSSIEIAEDDASSETYFIARHVVARDDARFLETFGGRYVDRFARRNGEWRIARRAVVHDWSRIEPLHATYPNDTFEQGRRTRDDLSYRRD